MKPIPDAHKKVPLMFRAQVDGRSQLQYLDPGKKKAGEEQDVELWVDEWIDKAELIPAEEAEGVETPTYAAKSYQISWRFVTNGGQDDGMLRPVIGASGIPFYPGSSMKGAFRQACQQMEKAKQVPPGTCDHYCGSEADLNPGTLRFLGAYPTNDWTDGLLDLVHPQQGWQVKTLDTKAKPKGESAYAQISLYQPTLRFAISSLKPFSSEQWQQIWQIWERAIAAGLGSKVSNGYGQVGKTSHSVLYRVRLKGQGQAAKLIDDTGEFRHNIFRAALRGHALRIFGGLTDSKTAEQLVDSLFGGIQSKNPIVGLLGFQFQESKLEMSSFGSGNYAQPCYDVEGDLIWYLTHSLDNPAHEQPLKKLVANLMQFAMIFGGFGKSWRRADHRKFFEDYYDDGYKALIGCHWQWLGDRALETNVKVWRVAHIRGFIDHVRTTAQDWMRLRGITPQPNRWANNWREAWHPSQVQVWGREAPDAESSEAIHWFHSSYRAAIPRVCAEGSIYKTDFVGKVSQVGRLWHRMYPVVELKKNPNDPKKLTLKKTLKFLELLTIFPDESAVCDDFLDFLDTKPFGFERLWGDE